MATKGERVLANRAVQPAYEQSIVGVVTAVAENGTVYVDLVNGQEAIPARSIVQWPSVKTARECLVDQQVLLCPVDGNRSDTIILGVIQTTVVDGELADSQEPKSLAAKNSSVQKPKTLDICATNEISIRCGKSTITLRADGTVVVKGNKLISRAARSNKIKGPSVHIN